MTSAKKTPIKWKRYLVPKNWVNYVVVIAVTVLFIILNVTGVLGKSDRSTLTRIGFSMILAVSLNLVVGFLGELSLGHAGFMCVGAYIGCFVGNLLQPSLGNSLLTLIISMVTGGVIAAVFGFIIGIPALRLKGDYLAITTLAFGEIVRNLFKNMPWFGGAKGLATDLYPSATLFIVTFVTLLIVLFLTQSLIRSKHGRAITAIRDNEIAARAMGINVTFYKLFVFILSAFFAGLAGVLVLSPGDGAAVVDGLGDLIDPIGDILLLQPYDLPGAKAGDSLETISPDQGVLHGLVPPGGG